MPKRSLLQCCLFPFAIGADTPSVTIHKVNYPVEGLCGQETNVTKSNSNPHYFFPIHFGGFVEGACANAGYPLFQGNKVVEMHPVPGVHHNLTFELYARP